MADLTDVPRRTEVEDSPTATASESLQPERHPSSPAARRQRLLMWLAFGTAALSLGGMVASTWVKSPAQIAASSEPPKDNVITAPVERKVLKNTVIFRGNFRSARSITFTPRTALAPDGSGGAAEGELLVTKKPRKQGDIVRPGMVIAEVSYRPIFVLRGKIPALRNLAQGNSGPDVVQLQRGLAELGYGRGPDAEGVFGTGTSEAVRRLYSKIGYPVPVSVGALAGEKPNDSAGGMPDNSGDEREHASTSVSVPRSEVMFVPAFPAEVSRLAGAVGRRIPEELLTVTIGGLELIGKMDPVASGMVKTGQQVEVFAEEAGKKYRAKVSAIGEAVTPKSTEKGQAIPYVPVRIKGERSWSAESDGQEARITVTVTATDGEVLAVPEGAISAAADGQTSVTVVTAAGERHSVPVTAGISADGYVAVVADGAVLRAGDRVVVGR